MIIAIDGPAASGKGTLARTLAAHYGLAYLDTGSLYRAVARDVLTHNEDPRDAQAASLRARTINPSSLDDPTLRDPGVGDAASIVASLAEVRSELLEYQRRFAKKPPGAILDGRDIGTTVCPDADVKLFITASAEVRANRRFKELIAKGEDVTTKQILADINRRDERDSSRAISPLKPAQNAHLLDTTNFDIETVYYAAVELIDKSLAHNRVRLN